MSDFKLVTKRNVNDILVPPQPGVSTEYFGERSNDIQLGNLNDFETVSGTEKLKQDINKAILTVRGTNTNNTLYGSALQTMVGGKVNSQALQAKIKDEIITALQVLQRANVSNSNADEQITLLRLLKVQLIDITSVEVQVSVITASGKEVTTGSVISV